MAPWPPPVLVPRFPRCPAYLSSPPLPAVHTRLPLLLGELPHAQCKMLAARAASSTPTARSSGRGEEGRAWLERTLIAWPHRQVKTAREPSPLDADEPVRVGQAIADWCASLVSLHIHPTIPRLPRPAHRSAHRSARAACVSTAPRPSFARTAYTAAGPRGLMESALSS